MRWRDRSENPNAGQKENCGNDGAVESVESQKQASQLFPRAPWKSRQEQARFPHFHSSGGSYICFRQNSKQEKKRKVWAMEKWKSKTRIPTFPPPRQPAAARRETILWNNPPSRL